MAGARSLDLLFATVEHEIDPETCHASPCHCHPQSLVEGVRAQRGHGISTRVLHSERPRGLCAGSAPGRAAGRAG
eukprot:11624052-Alexandrium_andersonii.AAC.1